MEILAAECKAQVICLQETKLPPDGSISLRGYDFFCKNKQIDPQTGTSHGGVAILASQKYSKVEIPLNTRLQAVAISIKLNKRISICSFYCPPGHAESFSDHEIEDLIKQLPAPFMILGDFNAKNDLWFGQPADAQSQSTYQYRRGVMIEKVLAVTDMHFLDKNKDTHVYSDRDTGAMKTSHIDLSLCSTSLLPDYEWGLYDQLLYSDHFPIWLRAGQGKRPTSFPKWKIHKADWPKFTAAASPRMTVPELDSVSEVNDYCKTFIIDAAEDAIPKTSGLEKYYRSPWWDKNCTKAKRSRAKDWKRYKRKEITKAEWHRSRAKTRQILKSTKRKAWKKFMESINPSTSSKDVWRNIKVLTNNYKSEAITTLKVGGDVIDDPVSIADSIGEVFETISSEKNCSATFLKYKKANEKKINFNPKGCEKLSYNAPITMRELEAALAECGDTATGPDDIHNKMLQNLSRDGKQFVLEFFNKVFKEGKLPEDWKLAHIIPILKKGKDPLDPKSYRPISLLSCLSKLLGRIVNKRLVWVLEKSDSLHQSQNGSRKGRSPVFGLLALENEVHNAFLEHQMVVAIIFDLEKAYDTSWRYLILKELYDIGLRGALANYIADFLTGRKFKVRIANKLSKTFNLEMGVPQGGILSVTLFLIAMNTVVRAIRNRMISFSIYVDDLRVSYVCSTLNGAQRVLNILLKDFLKWMDETGFKFSPTKTKAIIFRRGKKFTHVKNSELKLKFGNHDIEVVSNITVLGDILDEKMTWELQIANLKRNALTSLNALKIMAKHSRCGDADFLLRIYRTLTRTKIDYGCEVYGTAGKSYLERLDPVHHKALRFATGAYRTSNRESLYVVANEPSLINRRLTLDIVHYFRAQRIPNSSEINPWEDPFLDTTYDEKSNPYHKPPSYGYKTRKAIERLGIGNPNIEKLRSYDIPPWKIEEPHICFLLAQYPKEKTTPEKFRQEFLAHKHVSDIDIFTDGSKINEKVGGGVVIKVGESLDCFPVRIHDHSSVFMAELFAIRVALVKLSNKSNTTCCIYSDSRSALQAIEKFYSPHPIVQKIQENIQNCKDRNLEITFCWIPSHVGIVGNEVADRTAKDSLQLETIVHNEISASDFKSVIKNKILQKWQEEWDLLVASVKTPLTEIIFKVNQTKHCKKLTRTEMLKFNRLRIGHTKFATQCRIKNEPDPMCIECNEILTVKHVLEDCGNYYPIRMRIFGHSPLVIKNILGVDDECSIKKVLQYFSEIGLFEQI